MPPSRLLTFGPVRLERHDASSVGLESRKALALLCYVVAHAGPVARPHLVDLFWGDLPEERGRHNLRRVLSNIGASLPGWLRVDRHTVAFEGGADAWIDVAEVTRLRSRGGLVDLAAAVDMMMGDYLADLWLDGCPDFETWLVIEREQWRQRAAEMLGRLIATYRERGDYAHARGYAERLVALDPWREEAHRELMYLLALSGERSAALAQFETARRVLAEELGVEPSQETAALAEQIRSGELAPPPATAPARRPLPAPLTPLVGREAEVDDLVALLDPAAGQRLVTIVGLGGMGKSRLALEVAHRSEMAFAHGAAFVPLDPLAAAEFLVSAIVGSLGLRFEGATDPRDQLLHALRDQEMLLVLDGFERLLTAADLLIDILTHAGGVKLLVTSREALHLHAEAVFDVEGLPFPDSDTPAAVDYAAVRLFVQGAQRVRRRFAVTEDTRPPILRICRALRGLPLGLELAAALVASQSCRAIADAIDANLDILATTMRDVPPAHRSLRAVFEWSWRLLDDDEQAALAALAAFRAGFDRVAAADVALANAAMLRALAAKSLLIKRDALAAAEARYEMHELVRQYALAKLDEGGQRVAVYSRYLAFYADLAHESEGQLIGADQARWWERLAVEHDNLREALTWAMRHDPAAALRLAGSLWRFWFERCEYEAGERWLVEALDTAGEGDPAARAKALFGASRLAHAQGHIDAAWQRLEEGLPLAREGGDAGVLAFTASDLAWRRYEQGERASARALWGEALDVARQAGDRWLVAVVTASLGEAALNEGDVASARRDLAASVDLARDLGDALLLAFHLALLARALTACGEWPAAYACLGESLDIRQRLGNKANVAACLEGLAAVAAAEGEVAVAPWAVQLLGAADGLRDAVHTPIPPVEHAAYAATVQALRDRLPLADFAAAWAAGRALTFDDALALAHGSARQIPVTARAAG